MEYTQWELQLSVWHNYHFSLNPCCNGIYSMRESNQPRLRQNAS